MNRSRTAILINNYNNGPWIRACVDSTLAQTRPADEIIVYDDGSTDASLEVLRSYGPRIRLIEGVHDSSRPGRISHRAAITAAFAVSTADHVYLLDGDDAYLPEHLAVYEAAWAASPETVMLQGPTNREDAEGRRLEPFFDPRRQQGASLEACYRSNDCDFYYPTSTLAFRRDFLARVLPLIQDVEAIYANDTLLSFHAVFSGPVSTLPTPTISYRVRQGSMADMNNARSGPNAAHLRRLTRCFDQIAAHYGRPPLRLWKNLTYLQRLARFWLPGWMSYPFARMKAARYRRRH